jgi:hypothetical protein
MFTDEVREKIEYYERMIEAVKKTDEDVLAVKELFPDINIWVDKDVNCDFIAKSMVEVKKMLGRFAKAGFMLEQFNESESSPVWWLKGKNVMIRICPSWLDEKIEGATCTLVKVGEEVYTYPKYKLVCDDKEVGDEPA